MTASATPTRTLPLPLRVVLAPLIWLERAKGRKRLALAAAYLVIAVPIVAFFRWATCLVGLPDVEPFDRKAFENPAVPEQDDAFVLYRKAAGEVNNAAFRVAEKIDLNSASLGWSKTHPAFRRWVDDNRDGALATWRKGTERPNAVAGPARMRDDHWRTVFTLSSLCNMARLEGSRLEEQGDMAGAWGWYLAAYRSTYHICKNAPDVNVLYSAQLRTPVLSSMRRWAADPRVDDRLLHRALDDALACESLAPSDPYMLRATYLSAMKNLDQQMKQHATEERIGSEEGWFYHVKVPGVGEVRELPAWASLTFGRDAERSRRVVKLAFANWIARAESADPSSRPAIRSSGGEGPWAENVEFFNVGPEAPPAARALSPRKLALWVESTKFAHPLLAGEWSFYKRTRAQEHGERGALAQMLAERLYERERGGPPPSPEALVGPYLKRLNQPEPVYDPAGIPTTRDEAPFAKGAKP